VVTKEVDVLVFQESDFWEVGKLAAVDFHESRYLEERKVKFLKGLKDNSYGPNRISGIRESIGGVSWSHNL
jgi:hypothetical protein